MSLNDQKNPLQEQLENVRTRRDRLLIGSHVREALNDDMLAAVKKMIDECSDVFRFPPLYGTFCNLSDESVAEFESDIDLVTRSTQSDNVQSLLGFLISKKDRRVGEWYGGVFDIWAKATAARSGFSFVFDDQLPNGKRPDISLEISGAQVFLESTVLTENDESAKAWEIFVEARKSKHATSHVTTLNPYMDAIRFYTKVFAKLTDNLDASNSQLSDSHSNILLVSFAGRQSCSPGVGWAIDELFASQPLFGRRVDRPEIPDTSMEGWIDVCAHEMVKKAEITPEWYCEHYQEIVDAPRRLGGILLFRNQKLISSRINYNAMKCCSISHEQMATIERVFARDVSYWI